MTKSDKSAGHNAPINVGAAKSNAKVTHISPDVQEKALYGSLNDIKNVIAIMSGKGGVGKSSVTSLLACSLNRMGQKVGILDADITGPSQPRAFGLRFPPIENADYGMVPPVTSTGIKMMSINFFLPNEDDPVIWRGPMLAGAISQFWNEVDWRDLDYLLLDLPPGTGDVPLTVMQTLPIDGLVVVTSPQDLVLMVVKKTIKMARKINVPILGLVENMSHAVCPHCDEKLFIFGEAQGAKVSQSLGIDFLGDLFWDLRLNQLVDKGRVEEYESDAMDAIAAQIISRMNWKQ